MAKFHCGHEPIVINAVVTYRGCNPTYRGKNSIYNEKYIFSCLATSGLARCKKSRRIEKSNSNLHVNYNPMDGGCLMYMIVSVGKYTSTIDPMGMLF